ncbi:MAG: hypothetical protein IFK91_08795, partial [Acidobacteria bacterium]|nr:hypothetical protein [Candidatus Sulfomarinibacter sp. MAG AM1]
MKHSSSDRSPLVNWLLALTAVAVCGPWPGWTPPPIAVLGVCGGLLALARPRGRQIWPWMAVAIAVVVAVWPASGDPDPERLASQLDRHCRGMLATGEDLAVETELLRVLGAAGEAVDPALPFAVLHRAARGLPGRTIYLADDRGRVVAWGGTGSFFPWDIRPLGQRQWGISWSVGSADLWLREPLLVDGRLVGAIVISDHSQLVAAQVWGMGATGDRHIRIGSRPSDKILVRAANSPGVEVPVSVVAGRDHAGIDLSRVGWLLLAVTALVFEPRMAWLVVGVAGASLLAADSAPSNGTVVVFLLLAGASVARAARILPPGWSRAIGCVWLLGVAALSVAASPASRFVWLPEHLLRPGWGGVWMVALAWSVIGSLGVNRGSFTLARRLWVAAALAVLGLGLYLVRIPVELERFGGENHRVVLPRTGPTMAEILPTNSSDCRLDDLAAVLASHWRLADWQTPSELSLLDGEGFEISRWGDLSPAGGNIRLLRSWQLDHTEGRTLELLVATEPWSLLRDWRTEIPLEDVSESEVWSAALTRSGEVAASLHPEIQNLDAMQAGELFHAGGGWARIQVGGLRRLARVWRQGQWLVVAVSHYPSVSDWVVRSAIALLWALLGTLVALPPIIGKQHLSTFGGRLRLLVAGGVVVPLAVLTLFLH